VDTVDILVYDFSVGMGDTIFYSDQCVIWFDEIITLDTLFYFGKERIEYQIGNYSHGSSEVYEGIGSINGLIWPVADLLTYSVHLDCFDDDYEDLMDSECIQMLFTGVENKNGSHVTVYPNPVKDWLFLEPPGSGIPCCYTLEISDIRGRRVFIQEKYGEQGFDLSFLEKGVYFYTVKNGQQILTRGKLLKQ
jgi:hypothetical protein